MWSVLVLPVITILIYLVRFQYSYWKRRNVPQDQISIPFGSLGAVRRQERSVGLAISDIYQNSKEKMLGIYLFFRPALLVRDVALVRQILVNDFSHFIDRGVYVNEVHDPLSANLFSMRGQDWKTLRAKLMPSFSSGKLKGMFSTIDDVGEKMVKHLNRVLESGADSQVVEMKSVFTTYAVDIIGSVIFGLEVDSFASPNNEFRIISSKIFEKQNLINTIRIVATFFFPSIASFMARLGFRNPLPADLRDIVRRTVEFREQQKVMRKDLLQLLIQLRNTGKISEDDDKNWDIETTAEGFKSMSIDSLSANLAIFYIAGSETTAATAAFTLYELAMYPELLKRAQIEIEECLQKHGLKPSDKLTYDALQDMKFLDLCIMETTRKYPGLPVLNRECNRDYVVPGTDFTIEKGTFVVISLFGMHRDPDYFPDPLKYDPDRFSDDKRNFNPMAFMPFGEGPRHCIAQRMGKVNSKAAIVKILSNFNVEPNEHKEVEFIFAPNPTVVPKDGLNIRLSKKVK